MAKISQHTWQNKQIGKSKKVPKVEGKVSKVYYLIVISFLQWCCKLNKHDNQHGAGRYYLSKYFYCYLNMVFPVVKVTEE